MDVENLQRDIDFMEIIMTWIAEEWQQKKLQENRQRRRELQMISEAFRSLKLHIGVTFCPNLWNSDVREGQRK